MRLPSEGERKGGDTIACGPDGRRADKQAMFRQAAGGQAGRQCSAGRGQCSAGCGHRRATLEEITALLAAETGARAVRRLSGADRHGPGDERCRRTATSAARLPLADLIEPGRRHRNAVLTGRWRDHEDFGVEKDASEINPLIDLPAPVSACSCSRSRHRGSKPPLSGVQRHTITGAVTAAADDARTQPAELCGLFSDASKPVPKSSRSWENAGLGGAGGAARTGCPRRSRLRCGLFGVPGFPGTFLG